MIQFLQISVSLILFSNKLLVLVGKKSGWLLGAIGCTLAIVYLYMIELYVFTTLEFGLVALMLYGFLVKNKKNVKVENLIRGITVLAMCVMAYFAFTGMLTIYELLSSAGLLLGTYYLTHKRESLGWILYCIGHLLTAYLGYTKQQNLFADFQIASALVSLAGLMVEKTRQKAST